MFRIGPYFAVELCRFEIIREKIPDDIVGEQLHSAIPCSGAQQPAIDQPDPAPDAAARRRHPSATLKHPWQL